MHEVMQGLDLELTLSQFCPRAVRQCKSAGQAESQAAGRCPLPMMTSL